MSFLAEILLILIFISIYYIYNRQLNINKNQYLINKHLLDETCELYKKTILIPEITKLQKNYNLDENSQLNAIKAYRQAEENLIKNKCKDIYMLLTKQNRKALLKYYHQETILLIILNHLRS